MSGCRLRGFLANIVALFVDFKKTINEKVKETLQAEIRKFEKLIVVPQEFSPFDDVYISHRVTDLVWTSASADTDANVVFHAKATFKAMIGGRNVTFRPPDNDAERCQTATRRGWTIDGSEEGAHFLQGVRVSTEFLNRLKS